MVEVESTGSRTDTDGRVVVDGGAETNFKVNTGTSGSRYVESVELEAGVTVAVVRAKSPRSVVVGGEVEAARR